MGTRIARKSFLTMLILSLSSCSYLSDRKTLFDSVEDDGSKKKKEDRPAPKEYVTKDQYNALKSKHEDLLKRYQQELIKNDGMNPTSNEMAEKLAKAKVNEKKLVETVDVFGDNGIINSANKEEPKVKIATGQQAMSDAQVNEEVLKLNAAINLLKTGKLDEAMAELKKLETSDNKQVRVRSKFYIGELLFYQKEYDLAMQVFEGIIRNLAFSGTTLKTLGRLIVCAEKLNLTKKKEQYYSILHDFFGG